MFFFSKKIISILIILMLLIIPNISNAKAFDNEESAFVSIKDLANNENQVVIKVRFSDIPEGHWADNDIHEFRSKNITQGIGNNQFGLGRTITRGEFVTFLVRLMGWELISPEKNSFIDVPKNHIFYSYIETGVEQGAVIIDSNNFRPEDEITREEIAIIITGALGYSSLGKQFNIINKPFEDVESNKGVITIVKDFGIVGGIGNNLFNPYEKATREQAVAILMRMDRKLHRQISELHAFYALDSYKQIDFINSLDSVSFGWSRLEYDPLTKQVLLNLTDKNKNDFKLPIGFSEPVEKAYENNVSTQLNVFASQESLVWDEEKQLFVGLIEYIITNPVLRQRVIEDIVQHVIFTQKDNESIFFDGVVIDFENLKGELLRQSFNDFLGELKQSLKKHEKRLIVAVHPKRADGQLYYDGYDYKTIGEIADKVILMAHDYQANSLTDVEMENGYTITPLTPLNEIYYALKTITDQETGIVDKNKIWLQISFGTVQWKIKEGKVINKNAFKPTYEQIFNRLKNVDTMENIRRVYIKKFENPQISYYNNIDNTNNVIWYEDARSVMAKINLAKMFGIEGISFWRLGNIPAYKDSEQNYYLDIWQQIQEKNK